MHGKCFQYSESAWIASKKHKQITRKYEAEAEFYDTEAIIRSVKLSILRTIKSKSFILSIKL